MKTYTLHTSTPSGWQKKLVFSAPDIEAAKAWADDYARSNGLGTDDVGVEEVTHVPKVVKLVSPVAPAMPVVTSTPLIEDVRSTASRLSAMRSGGLQPASLRPATPTRVTYQPSMATPTIEKFEKAYPTKSVRQLGFGGAFESKHIRVKSWRSAIQVTDLENAGKRGKSVRQFSLYNIDYIRDRQPTFSYVYNFYLTLPKPTYDQALEWAKAISKDAQSRNIGVEIQEKTLRGVDVAPSGFEPISIAEKHFNLSVDNKEFVIHDLDDPRNEPTAISLDRHGKRNVKKLYDWALKNKTKLAGKTFNDVTRMLREAGINYHYYCAMD